ncbi:protein kinase domain-containing protein [Chondromyces crocatus]|uniref:Non-specific serine/threonine protein kinase n=1 Tax=Chondromyces crocatus TaxID=52 RepID=A0A0K1E8J0_CHOCO|nr:protein kinase [Chondromyces crocatus]AKT36898.1 uncharacterized protein CMC5_010190 [Chondromyces crocatus]
MSDGPKSSSRQPQTAPPAKPIRLGRYQLLKRIGLGGMAEIWVARVTAISGVQKICVVKRILPHLTDNPEFVRMFLDEARIAATLSHPNLVQMYDVEEVDRTPLISMEYLHGEDLRAIKKALRGQKRRMPLDQAVSIGIGMAAGLHYAHEKVGFDGQPLNIVHRDVSPHNVIVTYDGAVKLLDFGIAKAANRMNETRDGALKGKIPYMSPEQCRSERLDRRSDVYSTGIILYEITTGHRIFRRGATEFEIMRAIVEDQATPPTRLVIDFPEELERIILKSLAKNRAERYASARDLQIDLEAFAREYRLNTGGLSLSSFMGELFGKRAEAWREALTSGNDLLDHITERPPPSEALAEDWGLDPEGAEARAPRTEEALFTTRRSSPGKRDDDPAPAALPDPGHGGEPRALSIIRRRTGGLLMVSLSGRMTEAFQGSALAREMSGKVLFDLAGVERVTSFGVREWLQMLNDVSSRVSALYIARCSEPIVNQVSMIRRFVGDGLIVSFYGPYRCESCGNAFNRLFDCQKDADAIRAAEPPPCACPRCGAEGTFDDDAESYFAFATSYIGAAVPKDVRAVLDELNRSDTASSGEAIEKSVDSQVTRLRVACKLDNTVRWKRALDGIEGDLVIDLGGSAGVTPEGARSLEMALRALGDEVRSIDIEGCPRALCEHLITAKPKLRAVITSALVEARCESCNAMRSTILDLKEATAAALEDRDPYVPCKRCNTALSFVQLRPLLRRMGGARNSQPVEIDEKRVSSPGQPRERTSSPGQQRERASSPGQQRERASSSTSAHDTSTSVASTTTNAATATTTATATAPGRLRVPAIVATLVGAAAALGIAFAYRDATSKHQADPAPVTTATSAIEPPPPPPVGAPPDWATQPFVADAEQVLVVGQGTGPTREAALSAARVAAIAELIRHLAQGLSTSPLHALLKQRGLDGSPASTPEQREVQAARYLHQVGAIASPERDEVRFQEQDGQVTALARYRLRKDGFDAAVKSYERTVQTLGLSVAPLFPLLEQPPRAPGDLVVVAVDDKGPAAASRVRVGDVLISVNRQPVSGLDALESLVQKAPLGPIEVEVDTGGQRQTLRLHKSAR